MKKSAETKLIDFLKEVLCGMRAQNCADHIKPFAYFPELRHELLNGRIMRKIYA